MIIQLPDHSYSASTNIFSGITQMIRAKYKEEHANVIYCVLKDGIAQMKKELFETPEELKVKREEYEKLGFKVYSVTYKKGAK